MTKTERLLAVAGIGIVASAALLIAYVRSSNPADAQAPGCAPQRASLGQTLDQVRFSTTATHSVATAIDDTTKTRDRYAAMIAALLRQSAAKDTPAHERERMRAHLAQASQILDSQGPTLARATALLHEDERQLASATPLVSQASSDVRDGDCPALSLTLASSGWPKDRLIAELAEAARLNAAVNDQLEAALALILQAQNAGATSAQATRTVKN
jgi:hypothetical protein